MANWTTRKSRSQKIGQASYRSTQTITQGKGITNSQSFGSKAGRTTYSTGPKGTRMYETVRNGDMYMRTSRTLSSSKTPRAKKFRYRRRKAKPGEALASLFWLGLILLLLMVFA